jgi:hypothetical protein
MFADMPLDNRTVDQGAARAAYMGISARLGTLLKTSPQHETI